MSILKRITKDLGLSCFAGATLFINTKNIKLAYIEELGINIVTTYKAQERAQNKVANLHFYSIDCIFINIAKEVSLKNYILLYNTILNNFKAETYL